MAEDMAALLERWSLTLKNRAAYTDRLVIKRDLVPRFRGQKIARVTVRVVLAWLEELANTEMASQTHRERARPGRGRRGLGNRTVAGGRRAERREALRVTVTRSTFTT